MNNNIIATTGKFILNGIVLKDVDCRGGSITINGIIEGKTMLGASGKFIIGDSAEFRNEVCYWARHKANFKQSLKEGNAVFDSSLKIKYNRWCYLGFSTWLGLLCTWNFYRLKDFDLYSIFRMADYGVACFYFLWFDLIKCKLAWKKFKSTCSIR